MSLIRTELRRLLARRAVLLLLVLCVALPALMWVSHAWETRPVNSEELAGAVAMVERDDKAAIADCVRNPEDLGFSLPAGVDRKQACAESIAGSWYLGRETLDLQRTTNDTGTGVSVLVMGLLALTAATFAGADWSSGSISNQLLFEPRRVRVWLAKAVAVAFFAAVVTLAVLALWWAALWVLASARGLDQSPGTWEAVLGLVGRTIPLSAAFAVGAYALTMLLRSTVGTLSVLFAISVGATLLISALPLDSPEIWMPHLNVEAWLANGVEYWPMNDCSDYGASPESDCLQRLELPQAGRYLGVLLLAAGAASLASFRRRDVP